MARKDKEMSKLSSTTLGLIIGVAVVISAVALGLLYPKHMNIQAERKLWVEKTVRLEEQKRFFPIYAKAQSLADEPFENKLPFPERKAISRDQVTTLSDGVYLHCQRE